MKAIVLGAGLQGKAVIHDLSLSPILDEVIAVDVNPAGAEKFFDRGRYPGVTIVQADALDSAVLEDLIGKHQADIVVCMLPANVSGQVASTCIKTGVPFVNTSYAHWLEGLEEEAKNRGVTLLPEMGFDPGIDLILGSKAISELDDVEGLYSYGTGVPEWSACDNPLNYKITWTFEGVLKAYKRPARMLKEGREVRIPGMEIFNEENIHIIDVPGMGELEAYPNGDAVHFVDVFGLGPGLKDMGRFAARWPGHCAFWRVMSNLGFLDETPFDLGDGRMVSPLEFIGRYLTPQLQFKDDQRDAAVLRVHAWGRKGGRRQSVTYELVDYRDLVTGFYAMNRTVGYTAAIAAQMVLKGEITGAGILSPVRDINGDRVLEELSRRGVNVTRRVEEL